MWCGIYGIDGILLWDIMDGICQYYHGDITMGYYGIILQIFCKYSGWDMPTIVWYDVHRCLGHKMVPILRMVHILCSTFAVGPSDLIDIWPRAVCFGFIMWTWVKIGDGHKFAFRFPLMDAWIQEFLHHLAAKNPSVSVDKAGGKTLRQATPLVPELTRIAEDWVMDVMGEKK